MDTLLNVSYRTRKQTQYSELAAKYRVQSERSTDSKVAVGYKNLANVYEALARSLGKHHDLSGGDDQRAMGTSD
jgi:hypothetical protein